jgi:hypothetical protein
MTARDIVDGLEHSGLVETAVMRRRSATWSIGQRAPPWCWAPETTEARAGSREILPDGLVLNAKGIQVALADRGEPWEASGHKPGRDSILEWPGARGRPAHGGVIMRSGVSLGTLVWVVLGVVVALSHGYGISNVSSLVSFVLAMFLWPLVLLGVDLHVNLGV